MKVALKYGRGHHIVDLPERGTTVIEPHYVPALADERGCFLAALRDPIDGHPLQEIATAEKSVAVVFSDVTRPIPNERVIPWLLAELGPPTGRISLINATGMHRPADRDELEQMLTREVVSSYRVVNHVATDRSTLARVAIDGNSSFWVNAEYLRADVRILTGFIEPHFFAGFSGGPKSVMPGIAGADTILRNHSAAMIGHPRATWGVTYGNPIWEEIRRCALSTRPSFVVNVALNKDRGITGVFAGGLDAAHARGVEVVREHSMQGVAEPFDIVITTNTGYPLDLNLYQTIKGISAARQIVRKGGAIIAVSECCEGIPDHGNYKRLLHESKSPAEMLARIQAPRFLEIDQWEAQLQAMVQAHADVFLYSSLDDEEVRAAHLEPIHSVEDCVAELRARFGPDSTVAVLPQGPETIPYLESTVR